MAVDYTALQTAVDGDAHLLESNFYPDTWLAYGSARSDAISELETPTFTEQEDVDRLLDVYLMSRSRLLSNQGCQSVWSHSESEYNTATIDHDSRSVYIGPGQSAGGVVLKSPFVKADVTTSFYLRMVLSNREEGPNGTGWWGIDIIDEKADDEPTPEQHVHMGGSLDILETDNRVIDYFGGLDGVSYSGTIADNRELIYRVDVTPTEVKLTHPSGSVQTVAHDFDAFRIEVKPGGYFADHVEAFFDLRVDTDTEEPVCDAPFVSKHRLGELLKKARALVESDYTEGSWASFIVDRSAAQGIFEDIEVDQETVDNIFQTLTDAFGILVRVETDKTELAAEIALSDGIIADIDIIQAGHMDYYQASLMDAQGVYNNTEATQSQVDRSYAQLRAYRQILAVETECKVPMNGTAARVPGANSSDFEDQGQSMYMHLSDMPVNMEYGGGTPTARQFRGDLPHSFAVEQYFRRDHSDQSLEYRLYFHKKLGPNTWEEIMHIEWLVFANDLYMRAVGPGDADIVTPVTLNMYHPLVMGDTFCFLFSGGSDNKLEIRQNDSAVVMNIEGIDFSDYSLTLTVKSTKYGNGMIRSGVFAVSYPDLMTPEEKGRTPCEVLQLWPFANRTALQTAIALGETKVEADYTPETWAPLDQALQDGRAVEQDIEATQTAIDAATLAINNAIDALEEIVIVDKTALQQAIADAQGRNENDYTPSTWAAMQVELTAAIAVDEDEDAIQDDIDAAESALTAALTALVEVADKAALQSELNDADAAVESNYAVDSWTAFQADLVGPRAVLANAEATQQQVDDAVLEVQGAWDKLVDLTSIRVQISETEDLIEEGFTPNTWAPLQTALTAAKTAEQDPAVTAAQVATAEQDLRDARQNLVARADRTALVAALADADSKTESDYTPASWAVFAPALEAAHIVNEDLNATQQQVDDATTSVTQAVAGLVEKADKTALVAQINRTDGLVEADYTSDSWSALQTALTAANAAMVDDNVTQGDVTQATTDLQNAIDGLVVDKSQLQAALTQAGELSEDDYTPSTWATLSAAVTAGNAVMQDAEATPSQVHDATDAIDAAIATLVPMANFDDLAAAVATGNNYSEEGYLPDTWSVFSQALADGTNVLLDNDATQQQVDDATAAINAGISGLRADKETLQDALDAVEQLEETDYTENSWTVLQTTVGAGNIVMANEHATPEDVSYATRDINAAIGNLVPAPVEVDKSDLVVALALVGDYAEADYTPESWAILDAARIDGEAVNANAEATQQEVDDAAAAIRAAIGTLEPLPVPADKTRLEELLDQANAVDPDDYTADSFAALALARDIAQGVFENESATQEEVNTAADDLQTALTGLVPVDVTVDKSALEAALEAANEKVEADYTADSWAAMILVKVEAQGVFDDQDATQAEVNGATADLNAAVDALVPVPVVEVDKTALRAQITRAGELTEADYTPVSWQAMQDDLAVAVAVEADEDATQIQVDDAKDSLEASIDALVPVPVVVDKSPLQAVLTEAGNHQEEDYTPESWGPLVTAVSTGNDVMADEDATQQQVDDAAGAIRTALDALVPVEPEGVDKSSLRAVIQEAQGKDEADFTPETFGPMEEALAAAVLVNDDQDATQQDVDDAAMALRVAIDNLEPVEPGVDKSALQAAVNVANGKQEAKFTPESWQAMQDALSVAEGVLADEDATQGDVDQATTDLTNAIAALVPIDPEDNVDSYLQAVSIIMDQYSVKMAARLAVPVLDMWHYQCSLLTAYAFATVYDDVKGGTEAMDTIFSYYQANETGAFDEVHYLRIMDVVAALNPEKAKQLCAYFQVIRAAVDTDLETFASGHDHEAFCDCVGQTKADALYTYIYHRAQRGR